MSSRDDFLRTLLSSGLLVAEELRAVVAPSSATNGEVLADELIARGLLTAYQARMLLRGVTRGLVFGPFRILDLLGQGAMASAYLAHDTRNGQRRCLKVLPPRRAEKEERALERFRREMFLSQLVNHPHVVRCHEVGRQDGVYYLVLDYLPGQDLKSLIEAAGPLSHTRAARLFHGLASALEHVHARGMIHRDISPHNIMVGPDDHGWLLDFGLAILQDETHDTPRETPPTLHTGTPGYIAPEQLRDPGAVDGRADVYSLGCCLCFALTGKLDDPLAEGGELLDIVEMMLRLDRQSRLSALAVRERLAILLRVP